MKHDSAVNLFWAIVWGVVLALLIVGYFWWKPALLCAAIVAAVMFGLFLHDFIKYRGL